MESTEQREVRAARNQSLFRQVNERLEDIGAPFADITDRVSFTCECALPDCVDELELSVDEYERVRARPTTFVVAPGHVDPAVEAVVAAGDRFEVVEKIGAGGEFATAVDPRDGR